MCHELTLSSPNKYAGYFVDYIIFPPSLVDGAYYNDQYNLQDQAPLLILDGD